LASSIVEAGIKIWLALRDSSLKERKDMADYIAMHLKWESWESITAGPPASEAKSKDPP
jgi:hypothetical protein